MRISSASKRDVRYSHVLKLAYVKTTNRISGLKPRSASERGLKYSHVLQLAYVNIIDQMRTTLDPQSPTECTEEGCTRDTRSATCLCQGHRPEKKSWSAEWSTEKVVECLSGIDLYDVLIGFSSESKWQPNGEGFAAAWKTICRMWNGENTYYFDSEFCRQNDGGIYMHQVMVLDELGRIIVNMHMYPYDGWNPG